MTAREEYNAILARSGISLSPLGFRETGFPRIDALRVVKILRQAKCPVLGGDVYLRSGDRLEFAYAGWSTNPKPGEEEETYLSRSWDEAEAYIKNFPHSADAEVVFVVVFEQDLVGDIDQAAAQT